MKMTRNEEPNGTPSVIGKAWCRARRTLSIRASLNEKTGSGGRMSLEMLAARRID